VHRIIARSHKRLANEVGVWAARTFKNYREDLEDGGLETGSSPEVDFTEKAAAEEADDPVTATEESGVWSGLPSVFDCHSSSIRTYVDEQGMAWFAAVDVCGVPGYTNQSKTITDHSVAKGVTKRYTLTEGGEQEITFIYEPNLYRLIIRLSISVQN
jgi:hypothetical protein